MSEVRHELMTDMEKRIEAAAKEWHRRFLSHTGSWETVGQLERDRIHKAMRGVLSASFPEFFSIPPQAWLAPMEPTPAMEKVMRERLERGPPTHRWHWVYQEMRDAHLNPKDSP